MQLDEQIAEVVGALIGDGCLSEYQTRAGRRRQEIAFTGNITDFDYYENFIRPSIRSRFGVAGRLFTRDNNSTRYHIMNREAFGFFAGLGIPIGKKGRKLEIPTKILADRQLSIACIRGIWNTDGSIYRRYTKIYPGQKRIYDKYLVMQLKMISERVVRQTKEILNSNGIQTSGITKNSGQFVLRIGKQSEINRYFELVGFSNPHHKNRLKGLEMPIV